jgi:hypothetical protein
VDEAAAEEVWLFGSVDVSLGLLCGEGAGFDRGRGDCAHAQAVELGEGCAWLDDVHFGVGADINEIEVLNLSEQ